MTYSIHLAVGPTLFATALLAAAFSMAKEDPPGGALAGQRPRVFVFTDIHDKKPDPDDHNAVAWLLLHSDVLDMEGLVASRAAARSSNKTAPREILKVIDKYEMDYANLKSHSPRYPTPDYLRSITRSGQSGTFKGTSVEEFKRSPGVQLLLEAAKKDDSRPLWVLVWGGATDVAGALRVDESIQSKIRVSMHGSPNFHNHFLDKEGRDFLFEKSASGLWFMESRMAGRAVHRGGIPGGYPGRVEGSQAWAEKFLKGHGALGDFMWSKREGGAEGFDWSDGITALYLLRGTPDNPTQPSWGGSYVKTAGRSHWTIEGSDSGVGSGCETFRIDYLTELGKRADWARQAALR